MSTDVKAPSGPRASFGLRFGAVIIDAIILAIPQIIIAVASSQRAGQAFGTVLSLAYFTYFEGSANGQTIGKKAVGIRVIDFGAGGPIGYGRALLRWVARIVSSLPIFLGYFWMLWDKEKQTWHDKIATTVVVPVSDYPVS